MSDGWPVRLVGRDLPALQGPLTPRRRAVRDGLFLAGMMFLLNLFLRVAPSAGTVGFDAYSYWRVDLADPYRGAIGSLGWFPYSPALAQIASLFDILPWTTFLWFWLALLVGTIIWLGGTRTLWLLAFPPVAIELYHGNINLLIAAAIVLGFRYPAAWSFVILAKVTPGIGLLWFAVRREWRSLAIALGTTTVLAGISIVAVPELWTQWSGALVGSANASPDPSIDILPLWARLPLAAAIVAWGARTDRRWTVPVAATVAMPVLWFAVPAVLAAVLPLLPGADGHRFRVPGLLRRVLPVRHSPERETAKAAL
ncbi:MAG: DUF2029 domain-containing protein [Chloroflexi bacterium]|nr:DUF2029 domain-containing protein [Chloroflexota bacterium]